MEGILVHIWLLAFRRHLRMVVMQEKNFSLFGDFRPDWKDKAGKKFSLVLVRPSV
jgi:hypothetical protein